MRSAFFVSVQGKPHWIASYAVCSSRSRAELASGAGTERAFLLLVLDLSGSEMRRAAQTAIEAVGGAVPVTGAEFGLRAAATAVGPRRNPLKRLMDSHTSSACPATSTLSSGESAGMLCSVLGTVRARG